MKNQTPEELERLAFSAYCVAGSIVVGAFLITIAILTQCASRNQQKQ